MKRAYHFCKKYLLYILWSSFKRSTPLSFTLTTPLSFFSPWLTTFVLEPDNEVVLVVEQPNLTTLVVIPYSFWTLFKAREKE